MTRWGSNWRSEDSPFGVDEPGWVGGCRAEDEQWVTVYGFLDFPASTANPVDALPPGYPAYTAVMHSLEDPDSDGQVKWINDPDSDPWDQIEHIVTHGLGTWRFAADNAMAQPEGAILADALAVDIKDAEMTVTYFVPPWAGTVRSATIANRLRSANHRGWHVPVSWFPHTAAWVASTPYDAGWTYIASSTDIAQRLLHDPRIEALQCTYQDRPCLEQSRGPKAEIKS